MGLIDGGNVQIFKGHTNYVSSAALSPDGRLALSGSWDDTVKLWDVESGKGNMHPSMQIIPVHSAIRLPLHRKSNKLFHHHFRISLTVAFNSAKVRSYLLLAPGAFISGLGLIELTTRSNCLGLSSSRIYSLAVSTSPASANVMAIKMFSIFFDNPFIPDPPLP